MIGLISELLTQVLRLVPYITQPDPDREREIILRIQRMVSDELARRELSSDP